MPIDNLAGFSSKYSKNAEMREILASSRHRLEWNEFTCRERTGSSQDGDSVVCPSTGINVHLLQNVAQKTFDAISQEKGRRAGSSKTCSAPALAIVIRAFMNFPVPTATPSSPGESTTGSWLLVTGLAPFRTPPLPKPFFRSNVSTRDRLQKFVGYQAALSGRNGIWNR